MGGYGWLYVLHALRASAWGRRTGGRAMRAQLGKAWAVGGCCSSRWRSSYPESCWPLHGSLDAAASVAERARGRSWRVNAGIGIISSEVNPAFSLKGGARERMMGWLA
jgi:hypothetical protein